MPADYEQLLTRGLNAGQQEQYRGLNFDPGAFYEEKLLEDVRLKVNGIVRVVFPADGGRNDEFTIFEIGSNVILARDGNRFPVDVDILVRLQSFEVPGQGTAHIIQIRPPRLLDDGYLGEGNDILEKWIG